MNDASTEQRGEFRPLNEYDHSEKIEAGIKVIKQLLSDDTYDSQAATNMLLQLLNEQLKQNKYVTGSQENFGFEALRAKILKGIADASQYPLETVRVVLTTRVSPTDSITHALGLRDMVDAIILKQATERATPSQQTVKPPAKTKRSWKSFFGS